MHTQVVTTTDGADAPPVKTTFHYNSDMSGDVIVSVDHDGHGDDDETLVLRVPGAALLEFVGSRIQQAALEAVEGADWTEFTGGLTG